MKNYVCSLYDQCIASYDQLVTFPTLIAAKRSVVDLMMQDNPVRRHADDYSFYCLAEFDNNTGKLTIYDTPLLICKAYECLPPEC